jgi:anti-sigma regulatory factor (Ser/Thr protein kinase)
MDSESTARSQDGDAASNEVELPLPADVKSPGRARAFVRDRCPGAADEVLDDITLIVSELVSNAVKHGKPEIELRMRMNPLLIDISVLDHGPQVLPAEIMAPDAWATSGRGLSIVDRLASDWGVEPLAGGTGKTVWARLNVPA